MKLKLRLSLAIAAIAALAASMSPARADSILEKIMPDRAECGEDGEQDCYCVTYYVIRTSPGTEIEAKSYCVAVPDPG